MTELKWESEDHKSSISEITLQEDGKLIIQPSFFDRERPFPKDKPGFNFAIAKTLRKIDGIYQANVNSQGDAGRPDWVEVLFEDNPPSPEVLKEVLGALRSTKENQRLLPEIEINAVFKAFNLEPSHLKNGDESEVAPSR